MARTATAQNKPASTTSTDYRAAVVHDFGTPLNVERVPMRPLEPGQVRVKVDGLAGGEGAFLLCSFWLVEQIDPATGAFMGNFPQAFSHIGVISSGVFLASLAGSRS